VASDILSGCKPTYGSRISNTKIFLEGNFLSHVNINLVGTEIGAGRSRQKVRGGPLIK